VQGQWREFLDLLRLDIRESADILRHRVRLQVDLRIQVPAGDEFPAGPGIAALAEHAGTDSLADAVHADARVALALAGHASGAGALQSQGGTRYRGTGLDMRAVSLESDDGRAGRCVLVA
jgi:hypothetical protein